jgi:hypothetical protein
MTPPVAVFFIYIYYILLVVIAKKLQLSNPMEVRVYRPFPSQYKSRLLPPPHSISWTGQDRLSY